MSKKNKERGVVKFVKKNKRGALIRGCKSKLYSCIDRCSDCSLTSILTWFDQNRMVANPAKFRIMFLHGPYGVGKGVEIKNVIFQDVESSGKERVFKMAMEKLWILVWKYSKNVLKYMLC